MSDDEAIANVMLLGCDLIWFSGLSCWICRGSTRMWSIGTTRAGAARRYLALHGPAELSALTRADPAS